ncbi:hypothetical protein [Spirulina sp.]
MSKTYISASLTYCRARTVPDLTPHSDRTHTQKSSGRNSTVGD